MSWGTAGHEWIRWIAIEKLPDSTPEYVRAPEAAAEIAVMGRELDRSKGAGETLARLSPHGKVAKAIAYGPNAWDALLRFLDDGRARILCGASGGAGPGSTRLPKATCGVFAIR